MKKAAILCKGPSINKTWAKEMTHDYEITVAINEAIHLQDFATLPDILVCGDIETFQSIRMLPNHTIITYDNLFSENHFNLIKVKWSDIKRGQPFVKPENCFCGTHIALAFLAMTYEYLQEIHVYGNDMQGNSYFNGDEYDFSNRWIVESRCTYNLIDQIEKKTGIQITNI